MALDVPPKHGALSPGHSPPHIQSLIRHSGPETFRAAFVCPGVCERGKTPARFRRRVLLERSAFLLDTDAGIFDVAVEASYGWRT